PPSRDLRPSHAPASCTARQGPNILRAPWHSSCTTPGGVEAQRSVHERQIRMSEQRRDPKPRTADGPLAPGESINLPGPPADWVGPPGGDPPELERTYFDPWRWDAEMVNQQVEDGHDPAAPGAGRRPGQGTAALLVSDFHAA